MKKYKGFFIGCIAIALCMIIPLQTGASPAGRAGYPWGGSVEQPSGSVVPEQPSGSVVPEDPSDPVNPYPDYEMRPGENFTAILNNPHILPDIKFVPDRSGTYSFKSDCGYSFHLYTEDKTKELFFIPYRETDSYWGACWYPCLLNEVYLEADRVYYFVPQTSKEANGQISLLQSFLTEENLLAAKTATAGTPLQIYFSWQVTAEIQFTPSKTGTFSPSLKNANDPNYSYHYVRIEIYDPDGTQVYGYEYNDVQNHYPLLEAGKTYNIRVSTFDIGGGGWDIDPYAVFLISSVGDGDGDVDGDGSITWKDARLALRFAVGLEPYTEGSGAWAAADTAN